MMPAPAATSATMDNPLPFDPAGGVVTTDRMVTRKEATHVPPAMLSISKDCKWVNDYFCGPRIGGGQHGQVYICYKYNPRLPEDHPDHFFRVAMKCVMRNNQREEKWRSFKKQNQLPTTAHTQLVDRVSTQEAKIRKEIAIMKKLRHPHVVKLYEVIDDRNTKRIFMSREYTNMAIVMEYLGGGEVKWRNDKSEPILTVAQTRRIIRDAVLGLEYLHNQGIIHRDIKPANLLWTEDRQQVKIADFGVSHFSYAQRLAAAGDNSAEQDNPHDPILLDDSDLTRRAGTPSFLAPEIVFEHTSEPSTAMQAVSATSSSTTVQASTLPKRPPITKAIDVWALGVTLYCLLFGKTPFAADPAAAGSEWSLYNSICNSDWTVESTMGADRIPTGGRHPRPKDTSEGASVIRLLDHFLQKDMKRRITLEEVKRNAWILKDLPEPRIWLNVTSRDGRIDVSTDETSDAMSTVHFRWNWGALTKRVSSFLRIRSQRSRDSDQDGRGPVKSDPHLTVRRQKSAATSAHERLQITSSPIVHLSNNRDKGKRKADGPLPKSKRPPSQSLRSKSIDRWTANLGHSRNSSTVAIQGSSSKARRGSETLEGNASSSQSSPTASDKARSSTRFLSWLTRRGSPTTPVPGSPSPSEEASLPTSRARSLKQEFGARRSEEALRFHRFGHTLAQTSSLSAARRASSWGHGDEPIEFAEVSSLMSAERIPLNDYDISVGAGGVENSNERFTSVPRTPSKLASSPLLPPPPIVVPTDSSESESMFENNKEAAGSVEYLSTFSSEDEWQNGSESEDILDDGDEDDGDQDGDGEDSDDQDNALTFSPSKRPPRPE